MQFLQEIDGHSLGWIARLGAAYLLALPIAWDREVKARGVGLRTFPLVAIASCAFVLIGQIAVEGDDAQGRILAGLMTGIGFIGGGAILRDGGSVRGTSTATSIWITGAIGAAIGWDAYPVAIFLSVVDFLTLRFFRRLKDIVHEVDGDGKDDSDSSE